VKFWHFKLCNISIIESVPGYMDIWIHNYTVQFLQDFLLASILSYVFSVN